MDWINVVSLLASLGAVITSLLAIRESRQARRESATLELLRERANSLDGLLAKFQTDREMSQRDLMEHEVLRAREVLSEGLYLLGSEVRDGLSRRNGLLSQSQLARNTGESDANQLTTEELGNSWISFANDVYSELKAERERIEARIRAYIA